jgi:colicin import membrane protein
VTAIQARVVDETAVRREMERIAEAEREAARREREQQRLADERKEQARQEQLRVQREDAARAQRERDAEAQREREAEQQRQAEQRKREEEARRQAEARKQAELEAELAAAVAAEDEQRRAEEEYGQSYADAITSKIMRAWNPPPTARPGISCIINVTQIPNGEVTGASLGRCNGDDAVKQSILDAVDRASPLPRPPVPALFQRTLIVTFEPEVIGPAGGSNGG